MEEKKPAKLPEKKYKTTDKARELVVDEIRPYDMWTSGRCPVCGYRYSGDAFREVNCENCGQLLEV